MRWVLAAVAALGWATSAWAADEEPALLKIQRGGYTEAELRHALPKGKPSTTVQLSCLAAKDRFADCRPISMDPPGDEEIAASATKLVLGRRFDTDDREGNPVEGRSFLQKLELLAPGDRNPDWLRRPTYETLAAVMPKQAMRERKSGSATIRCKVTVEGYLDRCEVPFQEPAGYGFGDAALMLASQFAMKPKIRNGKPVVGEVTIPISWAGMEESGGISGTALVRNPVWKSAPSPAAVKAAFPAGAVETPAGQAALRCGLQPDGHLARCSVISELPTMKGFGSAAKALSSAFVVDLQPGEPVPKGVLIEIPFRFRNPAAQDDGRLTDVMWTQTLAPKAAELLFPEAARTAGLLTGVGYVECVATADGALTDCRSTQEEPADKGFGQAALEAAKLMKMNRWTKSGDPVEGRHILLPIRLRLDPPTEPPKP